VRLRSDCRVGRRSLKDPKPVPPPPSRAAHDADDRPPARTGSRRDEPPARSHALAPSSVTSAVEPTITHPNPARTSSMGFGGAAPRHSTARQPKMVRRVTAHRDGQSCRAPGTPAVDPGTWGASRRNRLAPMPRLRNALDVGRPGNKRAQCCSPTAPIRMDKIIPASPARRAHRAEPCTPPQAWMGRSGN